MGDRPICTEILFSSNMGLNFGSGLNYVKCDHAFMVNDSLALKRMETPFKFEAIKTRPRLVWLFKLRGFLLVFLQVPVQ